jgi:AraC-like DNA-binding protein
MAVLTKSKAGPARPVIASQPLLPTECVKDILVRGTGFISRKTGMIDHYFDCHAIGFVVSGRGLYRVNSGPWIDVGPGTMFAAYPGPRFHYGPEELDKGSTWDEYYITLSGSGLKRWVQAGWIPVEGRVYPLARMNEHAERYRELHRIVYRGSPGDADRAVLHAERLLMEMYYARMDGSAHTGRAENAAALETILSHCQLHYAEEIDFEALAAEHAMSYSLLRQRVRQITGLPPAQYLLKLRCSAARSLLTDTDLSVKEIAERTGLPDPYHFSRVFKRQTGCSPREYRVRMAPWSRKHA